jgi:hypothetical protein
MAMAVLVESIYEKKRPKPEQIATWGFLAVNCTIDYGEQHTKNREKSKVRKSEICVAIVTMYFPAVWFLMSFGLGGKNIRNAS